MSRIKRFIKKLIFRKSSAQSELEQLKRRGLRIGENVDIFSESPFDSLYPGLITVGDNVTISSNVKILAHDASMGYVTNGSCKIGIVEIGNNVFIGHGATILCNTRIGDYAVIGAGIVVSGDVPEGCVYAGNPAKFIKKVEDFKEQHIKNYETHPCFYNNWREFLKYESGDWDEIYEKLKETHGYIVRK